MSISMAVVSGEVSLCFLLTTFYIFLISFPPLPFFSPSSLFSSLFLILSLSFSLSPLPFSFYRPSFFFFPIFLSPPFLFFLLLSFSPSLHSFTPPSLLFPFSHFLPFFSFSSLISFSLFSLPPFSIFLQGVKISLSPSLFSPNSLFSPSYFILLLSMFHSPYSLCCRR